MYNNFSNKKTANFIMVALAAVFGGYYALYKDPRLGLDLKGGISVLMEAEDSEFAKVNQKSMERLINTLEKRVDFMGVAEPSIRPFGANRVLIEIPGVENPDEAIELIGKTGLLEFKIVQDDNTLGETLMTGAEIKEAKVDFQKGQRIVSFDLTEKGKREFYEITKNNVGRNLAIVLDGKLGSSATINSPIMEGSVTITRQNGYSHGEAKDLSLLLNSGSLPLELKIIEVRTVSATLGEESIKAGIISGKVAALMVSFFMILWYFLAGFIASLALALFGILTFGMMNYIGATFTLPGVAGFILSLGMAVDANVIIFEMIKEELRNGSTILSAIEQGFKKAYSSILDSNITTLMIAFILFIFGTGPIRGYSVALGIGILASMFTAIFVTQLLLTFVVLFFNLKSNLNFGFSGFKFEFNLIKYRYLFFAISLGGIAASSYTLYQKGYNYGIDFSGGSLVSLKFDQEVDIEQFKKAIVDFEQETKYTIQFSNSDKHSGNDVVIIKMKELSDETKARFLNNIRDEYGDFEVQREEVIGAAVGKDLKRNALLALLFGALLITIYVSLRFEFKFALAALGALIHDIVISVGLISYLGLEINSPFIVAILTILGYSINDTVVVFDRLRENKKKAKGGDLAGVINKSFNEVFTRSINTSFTTFLSLFALLMFSGDSLTTFLTTFLAGIVSGTYSSLFLASPTIYLLDRKK